MATDISTDSDSDTDTDTDTDTNTNTNTYLDLNAWPRRDAFDHYRGFDKPYFNVCLRLDVARLKAAVAETGVGGITLAYHFLTLRLANQTAPFRYRLRGERVLVHQRLWGGATVLRDDDSFGFAYLEPTDSFRQFAAQGGAAMAAARQRGAGFEPRLDDTALVHFTTLPWLHFTSFSHARNWGREDSIPKLSFGRLQAEGVHLWLPFSVEVHHALMDGLHVGRYVQALEAALQQPRDWLEG